jgi:alkylated DNA repair dioxygenase AlkB
MHILVVHAETCQGKIVVTERPPVTQLIDECVRRERDCKHTKAPLLGTIDVPAVLAVSPAESRYHILTNSNTSTESDKQTQNVSNPPTLPWWTTVYQSTKIKDPILPASEPLPGLFLFPNFITEEEEAHILAHLDVDNSENPWKLGDFNGPHLGKRWGVHCNLRDRRVGAAEHALPTFVTKLLLPRLHRIHAMKGMVPNEANAIDYRSKQGHYLTHHVDDRKLSREPIANLSLAGECRMVFRNMKGLTKDEDGLPVLLERRTLQVLTGKARYEYAHGIDNSDLLSDRRVSITMRESPMTTQQKV